MWSAPPRPGKVRQMSMRTYKLFWYHFSSTKKRHVSSNTQINSNIQNVTHRLFLQTKDFLHPSHELEKNPHAPISKRFSVKSEARYFSAASPSSRCGIEHWYLPRFTRLGSGTFFSQVWHFLLRRESGGKWIKMTSNFYRNNDCSKVSLSLQFLHIICLGIHGK